MSTPPDKGNQLIIHCTPTEVCQVQPVECQSTNVWHPRQWGYMEGCNECFTGLSAEFIWIWHTLSLIFSILKMKGFCTRPSNRTRFTLSCEKTKILGENIWKKGMQDTGNQATKDCEPWHKKNKVSPTNCPSLLPWENFQDMVQREEPGKARHSLQVEKT